MKQTRLWLTMAMMLLCSMTRAEVELSEYCSHDFIENSSMNEDGTWQYEYTSDIFSCDASFETIVLTFLGSGGDSDKSGYPWVSLAEFYLYDGEGNEIALTAENFATNAQEPTEGPLENICDGDRTTFFHSMWSVGASDNHKLMITLPEDIELKEFKFKYITRWISQGYPLVIRIATDNGNVIIPRGTCGDNVTYTLTHDGHLDIAGSGAMADDYYFERIGLITSVTIQEGVTSIGSSAFCDCTNLISVTIPESVEILGGSAFSGCTSLTTVTIPDNSKLTKIERYVFMDCSCLTAITIPANVSMIEESFWHYPFFNCSSLTSIIVAEGNPKYDSRNGCNAIINTESNRLILGCSTTVIPESVTSIGECAFYGCGNLTSITIPESVTSIERYTFYGCSGLTSVTLLGNTTEISTNAFGLTPWYENQPDGTIYLDNVLYGYKGEMPENTSIVVREGTAGINREAFRNCSGLTSITIPESVTSVGRDAFMNCNNLEQVVLHCANIGDWFRFSTVKEVVLGEGVTSIDKRAFGSGVERVTMNCPIVDSWWSERTTIKEIVLGDNVAEIKANAFKDCSSLATITLGSGLSKIGNQSFSNCSALTSITCHAVTPPSVGLPSRTFQRVDSTIPVYVPAASVSSYQSDKNWIYFTNFVGLETGIDNKEIMSQGSKATRVYDLRGNRVENPMKGIYIIGGKKVVIK